MPSVTWAKESDALLITLTLLILVLDVAAQSVLHCLCFLPRPRERACRVYGYIPVTKALVHAIYLS